MPNEKKFPYKAWRLMPSFKPAEVEIVGNYQTRWGTSTRDLTDAKGKRFGRGDLFDSKSEAIRRARSDLGVRQAEIDKKQASVDKKRAELDKAETA